MPHKINALALGLILAMYNEQLSDHSNRRIGARLRPADKEEGATMTKIIFSIVGVLLTACLDIAAVHASMQGDVDQAVKIIQRFQEIPERAIPDHVLRDAHGVAILPVAKAGFIGSARGGGGAVIARTAKGWSAPSALG